MLIVSPLVVFVYVGSYYDGSMTQATYFWILMNTNIWIFRKISSSCIWPSALSDNHFGAQIGLCENFIPLHFQPNLLNLDFWWFEIQVLVEF